MRERERGTGSKRRVCVCMCVFRSSCLVCKIGRSFAFHPELCVCVRVCVNVKQALIKGSAAKQQHFISAGREIKFC